MKVPKKIIFLILLFASFLFVNKTVKAEFENETWGIYDFPTPLYTAAQLLSGQNDWYDGANAWTTASNYSEADSGALEVKFSDDSIAYKQTNFLRFDFVDTNVFKLNIYQVYNAGLTINPSFGDNSTFKSIFLTRDSDNNYKVYYNGDLFASVYSATIARKIELVFEPVAGGQYYWFYVYIDNVYQGVNQLFEINDKGTGILEFQGSGGNTYVDDIQIGRGPWAEHYWNPPEIDDELGPFISHDYDYVDENGWRTIYLGPSDYARDFYFNYHIQAPITYNVQIWWQPEYDEENWILHDASTVWGAYNEETTSYNFYPLFIATSTVNVYTKAILLDTIGSTTDEFYLKLEMDEDVYLEEIYERYRVSSSSLEWTYDIDSACDDVATSSESFWDDMRYGIECSFRKLIYWSITPKETTKQKFTEIKDLAKRTFPINIFYDVKNAIKYKKYNSLEMQLYQYDIINKQYATTTIATSSFMQTALGPTIYNYYNTVWLIIIYGLGLFFVLKPFLKSKMDEE